MQGISGENAFPGLIEALVCFMRVWPESASIESFLLSNRQWFDFSE